MWEQINRLYLFMRSDSGKKILRSSPFEFFKRITVGSHLFQGITDATMTHGEGWDFIRIGKLLERADCTSRMLDVKYHILLPSGEKVGGNIDTISMDGCAQVVQRTRSLSKNLRRPARTRKWLRDKQPGIPAD
jgi:uncharacterized alpha-E superfamily protein